MEKLYVVRNVRTGRWLHCEMYVGKLIAGWSLYVKPQAWTRAQAQALACVWIACGGDGDLVIEEASAADTLSIREGGGR